MLAPVADSITWYDILGVSAGASSDTLHYAYAEDVVPRDAVCHWRQHTAGGLLAHLPYYLSSMLARRNLQWLSSVNVAAVRLAVRLLAWRAALRASHQRPPRPRGRARTTCYAPGSLVNLMGKRVGPAFQAATGCSVTGYPAGSKALAAHSS